MADKNPVNSQVWLKSKSKLNTLCNLISTDRFVPWENVPIIKLQFIQTNLPDFPPYILVTYRILSSVIRNRSNFKQNLVLCKINILQKFNWDWFSLVSKCRNVPPKAVKFFGVNYFWPKWKTNCVSICIESQLPLSYSTCLSIQC